MTLENLKYFWFKSPASSWPAVPELACNSVVTTELAWGSHPVTFFTILNQPPDPYAFGGYSLLWQGKQLTETPWRVAGACDICMDGEVENFDRNRADLQFSDPVCQQPSLFHYPWLYRYPQTSNISPLPGDWVFEQLSMKWDILCLNCKGYCQVETKQLGIQHPLKSLPNELVGKERLSP